MENRNGRAVGGCLTQATGRAAVAAALELVEEIEGWERVTLGADKGEDRKELGLEPRAHQVTPPIACQPTSIIAARTTRPPGGAISQRKRKRVEGIYGWLKTVAGLCNPRHRGVARVGWMFTLAVAAYHLVRMRTLLPAPA